MCEKGCQVVSKDHFWGGALVTKCICGPALVSVPTPLNMEPSDEGFNEDDEEER